LGFEQRIAAERTNRAAGGFSQPITFGRRHRGDL
jgi:hypothetical protein